VSALQYIADNWGTIGPEIVTHLLIVAICMLAATAVGVMLGVAAARNERVAAVALSATSVILTIPSFALFGLLTIWLGLGNPPVIIGLALYALLPVTRNTRAGVLGVDPSIVEAARGMGMSRAQLLLRVELPLALPVMLAGIRQATVMVVAIATVGATVGADDLGRPILDAVGRTTGSYERIIAGILPVAAIGILADVTLGFIERSLGRTRTAPAAA
jgi:osmoprotectant transport system permease protein